MKKILIVVESLECGGGEKSLISLLPQLDYDKYDIDLLIHNKGKGLFKDLVDKRVNILPSLEFVEFCKKNVLQQIFTFRFDFIRAKIRWFFEIRKKKNKLRHPSEVYWDNCNNVLDSIEKKYDVAIAWGQGNSTHYVADKVCAKKKYAWINANYNLGNHDKEYDLPFYKKIDRIIVVSKQLLLMTQEVFPEFANNMLVIYDIINANLIQKMATAKPINDSDKLKIVTIARLEKPKGFDIALKACKILKEKGENFVWYVIGEGSERDRIEEYINNYKLKDYFKLLGAKSNPYGYLNQADIYVQTSIFEGYCLTLAEARILNKPIVTTNFDVVYDQIKNRENGSIVDMNACAVANGIIELINNKELRKKYIKNLKNEKKGNIEEVYKVIKLLDE